MRRAGEADVEADGFQRVHAHRAQMQFFFSSADSTTVLPVTVWVPFTEQVPVTGHLNRVVRRSRRESLRRAWRFLGWSRYRQNATAGSLTMLPNNNVGVDRGESSQENARVSTVPAPGWNERQQGDVRATS